MRVDFEAVVFEDGNSFVAYCPHLDVTSCGKTPGEARENLKTAVRLFLEEADRMGTLLEILDEAGYTRIDCIARPPKFVTREEMTVTVGV